MDFDVRDYNVIHGCIGPIQSRTSRLFCTIYFNLLVIPELSNTPLKVTRKCLDEHHADFNRNESSHLV